MSPLFDNTLQCFVSINGDSKDDVLNITLYLNRENNTDDTFLIFLDINIVYIPTSFPTCIIYIILSSINL